MKSIDEKSYKIEVAKFANVSFGSDSINLYNVLYVPALNYNLILVRSLIDNRKVVFKIINI